jgi:hypothetical protein
MLKESAVRSHASIWHPACGISTLTGGHLSSVRLLRREADLYMASRLIHFPISSHCVMVKQRDLLSSVGIFKQGAVAQFMRVVIFVSIVVLIILRMFILY